MRSKNMRGNNTNNKHRELQRFLTSQNLLKIKSEKLCKKKKFKYEKILNLRLKVLISY